MVVYNIVMQNNPLFIPLKTEYFDAFKNGSKKIEYRKYGNRWNEKTCIPGQSVVLSCGYGKQKRIDGIIRDIKIVNINDCSARDLFIKIYGFSFCFVIEIGIDIRN